MFLRARRYSEHATCATYACCHAYDAAACSPAPLLRGAQMMLAMMPDAMLRHMQDVCMPRYAKDAAAADVIFRFTALLILRRACADAATIFSAIISM